MTRLATGGGQGKGAGDELEQEVGGTRRVAFVVVLEGGDWCVVGARGVGRCRSSSRVAGAARARFRWACVDRAMAMRRFQRIRHGGSAPEMDRWIVFSVADDGMVPHPRTGSVDCTSLRLGLVVTVEISL
jgi:hypothetical protein